VCPSGHRNEVLDCTVIVLFLAQAMGYHTTPASTWQKWRDALAPDLFSAPAPSQARPEAPQAPAHPRRVQPAAHVAHPPADLSTSVADDELFAPIPMH
jgi:phage terminase large subunit GpA-like protein